ncbi:MAG: hypothetical protein QMB08_01395 [Acidimicrobiales bacterium]|jgi:hypothetical protein|tara:strand:- start:293 stop:655 length:363 start_codon:yes stop_codon:yes gene_type:complete
MSRGNNNRGNQSGGGNQSSGPNNRKRKKNRKKPKLDPVKYWGDPTSLPIRSDYVLQSSDPTAVIRSLGKAPIPGKNSAPELYFEVLYNRATGLAQALAFAGGLNEDAPATAPSTEGDSED